MPVLTDFSWNVYPSMNTVQSKGARGRAGFQWVTLYCPGGGIPVVATSVVITGTDHGELMQFLAGGLVAGLV